MDVNFYNEYYTQMLNKTCKLEGIVNEKLRREGSTVWGTTFSETLKSGLSRIIRE